MKIKGKRVLKNGAIAGYIYYNEEKKWKWRIIKGPIKTKKQKKYHGGTKYEKNNIITFVARDNPKIVKYKAKILDIYKNIENTWLLEPAYKVEIMGNLNTTDNEGKIRWIPQSLINNLQYYNINNQENNNLTNSENNDMNVRTFLTRVKFENNNGKIDINNFLKRDNKGIIINRNGKIIQNNISNVPFQYKKYNHKPNGIWYACGIDTWNKFVENEGLIENRKYKYKYLLEINPAKILFIKNDKDMINFIKKYKPDPVHGVIWENIAREYSGIEICPYLHNFRYTQSWYYPWDIASGCIWKNDAIKNVKRIEL